MKILVAFAPSQDTKDRFFSTTPTSLGWALAPLIKEIDQGNLPSMFYYQKIFDPLRIHAGIWDEFTALLKVEKPDILILSSTYDSHYSAIRLSVLAKRFNPGILVIYGGPHVDEVTSKEVIAAMPQIYPFNEPNCPFDILIKGDGELILLHLIRELSDRKTAKEFIEYLRTTKARMSIACVPGNFEVHVKTSETTTHVLSSSGLNLDLSALPFIPRKLFGNNLDIYGFSCFRQQDKDGGTILLPSVSTMLHRGCRSFCIFCSERGGYLSRNLEHIASELDGLVKSGIKGVFFDDSTLGDHEDLDELLACLQMFPLQYASLNRFDTLQDPLLVQKLAESGFVYQYCSIEQFDRHVLKNNGKGQSIEAIRRGVKNLADNGIQLGVSLLFGLQGETEDSVNTTLDFVAEIDKLGILSCVSLSLYSYHPNTPLTLGKKEGKSVHPLLSFNREPPNQGYPWNCFEEGQWFHPPWLSVKWVEYILSVAEERIGHKLVRNMEKDGYIL